MASEGNTNGVLLPSVWQNPYHFNFDSFGSSFMTLFMVSTFKFVAIMWACMDITDVNVSPLQNNSTHWSVFYILYILVGALFVMNLFVAFIIDGFNAAKGSTVQEEIFRRFRRQLYAARPKYETFKPPENVVSTQLRKMLESKVFQAFSTTCVFVNVGMLLADNADADEHYQQVMETQNNIFYGELVFEVVLCTIAYGPLGFYNDFYRAFDLFVCVGSALGYIFNNKAITSFVKVFRLARVIRLAARIRLFIMHKFWSMVQTDFVSMCFCGIDIASARVFMIEQGHQVNSRDARGDCTPAHQHRLVAVPGVFDVCCVGSAAFCAHSKRRTSRPNGILSRLYKCLVFNLADHHG